MSSSRISIAFNDDNSTILVYYITITILVVLTHLLIEQSSRLSVFYDLVDLLIVRKPFKTKKHQKVGKKHTCIYIFVSTILVIFGVSVNS